MGTISTFLRAIRAGAVHVRHSAVLLAHYGRLGPAFDLCTKVIIDSLREEGMYRENGDLVVDVVTQALKESFTLVLDSVVRGEDHVVTLAKQLGQSFIIRGAQLSIVKKLDSQYIVQTHTNLLTWIVKLIGTYEAAKNKKARKTAILFFRVLQPLLAAVDSRDALKIKAHMDQVLAQTKIEVPPSSKIWEPQRAYEKKLSSIMAKDKGGARAERLKVQRVQRWSPATNQKANQNPSQLRKNFVPRNHARKRVLYAVSGLLPRLCRSLKQATQRPESRNTLKKPMKTQRPESRNTSKKPMKTLKPSQRSKLSTNKSKPHR
jgi:cohesin complex subunit SA-1/2